MPSNCGAGENPWKSFAQQGDQTNLKENQPWILIGRTNAEAEAPVFWSFDVNSKLIGKVPDPGKDWGQKEKRVSEDEVAGLHCWYNGHELGQTSGDGEGQGGLVCCSPWGHKELDSTGQLTDWTTTRQNEWSLLWTGNQCCKHQPRSKNSRQWLHRWGNLCWSRLTLKQSFFQYLFPSYGGVSYLVGFFSATTPTT